MKAVANFPDPGEIRVLEVPVPALENDTDVLVKTLAIGLCGTDKEIASQDYGKPPAGCDHLIIGHECLGEVVDVGPGVKNFEVGDLVVPRVRRPCAIPTCTPCRRGRPDFCLTGKFTERGINGAHGFMVEQFVESEPYLHRVPPELRQFGVLTEPLTIAMKSLIQTKFVQQRLPYVDPIALQKGDFTGSTAVVLGAGPVGLLGALVLLNAGANVFVYSREEEPNASSDLIESCGGEYVSSNLVDGGQLAEMVGPVQIMYEATGASKFAFDMATLLGRNGIYILTGVPGRKGPVPVSVDVLMRDMVLKNQVFVGTVNAGPPAFEESIAALGNINRRWPGVPERLITERLKPDEVAEALKAKKSSGTIKQVVVFGGSGEAV